MLAFATNSGRKRGLRFKATTVAVASVVLALLIMATASIIQSHAAIVSHEEEAAAAIASAFASVISSSVIEEDKTAIDDAARHFLAGNEHILFVTVYGSHGNLLVYRKQGGAPSEVAGFGAAWASDMVVREHVIRPLGPPSESGNDAPIGRVMIGVSAGAKFAALREQSLTTLLMVIVGATLSISLIHVTIRRWAHRLDQLVEVTAGMSEGDYNRSLDDAHHDEIGELSRGFERMRNAVQERDAELRQLNHNLMEQVRERTCDLEASKDAAEHAQEVAEQASRAKSEFLANMSHELRTPLNGVVGMVELLRGTKLDGQQQRYIDICRSSADSLLNLITDILDFSKIEAGRVELESIVFNLRSVTEDVAEMLAQNADRCGLELACYLDPGVPEMVCGDRDRLRQVLTNIVNNAIKFTEKGEVVIRVMPGEEAGEHQLVRFSVTDTGIGIPKDRMDRLFKSFSQVDSSTTRKYGGTGLGLAISKRLIEMMGGEIWVESKVDRGSTFSFTVQVEVQPGGEHDRKRLPPDVQGLRTLIVDDNATNRLIFSTQLANWGIEVETAERGDQALHLLRQAAVRGQPFQLALLDMAMPHMDGLELAEAIHRMSELQPIAMVMLTSFDEVIDHVTRERVGISACLQKPARQADLFQAIAEAISHTEPPSAPLKADVSEPITASPVIPSRVTTRILVAEDNEANRMVASEIIRLAGYEFDIVDTGKAAVEAVRKQQYGLVLMDCQMPEMDGFEATRRIRDLEQQGQLPGVESGRLPIIALTANAIKGDRERCLDAGMDDYLAKPVEPKTLIATIASYLGQAASDEDKSTDGMKGEQMVVSQDPIDAESLLARCVNNVQFLNSILDKFESEAASYLDELQRSLQEEDAESSARVAHRLAGLAAVLSANDLQAVAAQMETLARENRVDELDPLSDELRTQAERCFEFIPTLRERLAEKS